MDLKIGDIIYSPDGITEFQIYSSDQDRYWCEWSDRRGTFWMLKECLEKDITDGIYKVKRSNNEV